MSEPYRLKDWLPVYGLFSAPQRRARETLPYMTWLLWHATTVSAVSAVAAEYVSAAISTLMR